MERKKLRTAVPAKLIRVTTRQKHVHRLRHKLERRKWMVRRFEAKVKSRDQSIYYLSLMLKKATEKAKKAQEEIGELRTGLKLLEDIMGASESKQLQSNGVK